MNKAYVIVPLISLLIFGGFYWNFATKYAEKQRAKEVAIRTAKEDKIKEEQQARRVAVEDAIRLQEQRKKEKIERDEKDRLEKEARQDAIDARDKSYRDQEKLAKQVDRLTKEITVEREAIAKVEDTKKLNREEEAFLRQFVKQAESNVKRLAEVIDKIDAADKARAEAAAAAAAAAAAKSKS
jgi:colicin import membrane protein